VLNVAGRALSRALSRRVRRVVEEQVLPAVAARADALLGDRVNALLGDRAAIAERHPELRACLNDGVVFVVGGTRVLPLASALTVRTAEQSDALVAQLQGR
jgi:hypothetical protein